MNLSLFNQSVLINTLNEVVPKNPLSVTNEVLEYTRLTTGLLSKLTIDNFIRIKEKYLEAFKEIVPKVDPLHLGINKQCYIAFD
jgi:hypothetical protein